MHEAGLPHSLWMEAVRTAIYLKNLAPTAALDNMTPEEAWTGEKPDASHLRAFGCKALAHVPDEKQTKLQEKASACILVRNSTESKAY